MQTLTNGANVDSFGTGDVVEYCAEYEHYDAVVCSDFLKNRQFKRLLIGNYINLIRKKS